MVDANDETVDRDIEPPTVDIRQQPGATTVVLGGDWTLRGLCRSLAHVRRRLREAGQLTAPGWDLGPVRRLDSTGALILWQAWGRSFPDDVRIREGQQPLFRAWREHPSPRRVPIRRPFPQRALGTLARPARSIADHVSGFLSLFGRVLLDLTTLVRRPRHIPWREISATIHLAGTRAMGIAGVLGFLFGVVLAYQAAIHLRGYGAEGYVADMLGFSIVRELGPVLTAVLLAGRSGSSMTAQIGVMRLTQEIDAMKVMGISVSQRLILPKVIGMIVVAPLLTLWLLFLAMTGAIMTTDVTLGLGFRHYLDTLPVTMPVVNLAIGLGKAAVFGGAIALAACHYGLRIHPNTRSLAAETTHAVVAGITLIIVINAVFTVVLQDVGFKW